MPDGCLVNQRRKAAAVRGISGRRVLRGVFRPRRLEEELPQLLEDPLSRKVREVRPRAERAELPVGLEEESSLAREKIRRGSRVRRLRAEVTRPVGGQVMRAMADQLRPGRTPCSVAGEIPCKKALREGFGQSGKDIVPGDLDAVPDTFE